MSIGFMGDGKPSNNNQPKRPRSVRGYKTKKIVTEHYGRKDVSWERVPRSGYGSAFFSLFTVFLAILVLFNVATGSGYETYTDTVNFLYASTETVGSVVNFAMNSLAAVSHFLDPESFIARNPYGIDDYGCFYVKVRRNFEYRDFYKVRLYKPDIVGEQEYTEILYEVVESNLSKVPVGSLLQITNNYFKGDVCTAYKNWFLSDDDNITPLNAFLMYSGGNRIRHCSEAEYLEKTKE